MAAASIDLDRSAVPLAGHDVWVADPELRTRDVDALIALAGGRRTPTPHLHAIAIASSRDDLDLLPLFIARACCPRRGLTLMGLRDVADRLYSLSVALQAPSVLQARLDAAAQPADEFSLRF